ncbi:MAG: hypothetical protein ACK4FK_01710 [Ferrovibrio sp.]|jgi:hypothetical protein
MSTVPLHDEHKRRRARNIALGLVLGALVVLFYFITIAKMTGRAA